MAEEETEFAPKKWVVLMAMVAAVVGGGVGSFGLVRVDGFTSTDWELKSRLLRHEILTECREYVDDYLRPPTATRIRIQAMEASCERIDPEYRQPTNEWQ